MTPVPERTKAILLLILTAALWSLGGLLVKLIQWNPLAIAGMRSIIAAVTILTFFRRPTFTWSLPEIGGAIAYAGTVTLYVVANKLTTAANTILLQYTAPIYVALFGAWYLKERTTFKDWICIVIVFGGMSLFFLDKLTTAGVWGNIAAIFAGVCFGWTALFLRKQKGAFPINSILLGNLLTAIICLPYILQSTPATKMSWIGLIVLGIVQLGIPYILYSIAIKSVTALDAIIILMIEPVLNPIWVFLIIGEVLSQWAFVGGVIVLLTITLRGIWEARKKVSINNKSSG